MEYYRYRNIHGEPRGKLPFIISIIGIQIIEGLLIAFLVSISFFVLFKRKDFDKSEQAVAKETKIM
jgi:hypothetical protein